jgi:DNA-directed RNA polymerase omega subunit
MNNEYLERAKQQIPAPKILAVIAAKRAKQLAVGARPMVKTTNENYLDVALLEIAEGLLVVNETPAEELDPIAAISASN